MRYDGPHFERKGMVSIWVGVFPSESARKAQLKERYGEEFEDEPLAEWMGEFGFGWFDHDQMDTNWDGLKGQPLRDLLGQCSYAASFLERAVAAGSEQGIEESQTALLLYDFKYDPKVTGVTQGKYLRFLGTFRYSDKEP
jgi:hypothetical protein